MTAIPELDGAADVWQHAGTEALRRGEELVALVDELGLVDIDRGLQHRDLAVLPRHVLAARRNRVEPVDRDAGRPHLGPPDEVFEEGAVAHAAVDDDRRVGETRRERVERLVAGPSEPDQLREHRVVLGPDDIALVDAAVEPQARARRHAQHTHHAGSRRETTLGVFGGDAHLDRMARGDGRLALERSAAREVDLQHGEIDPRGQFGDRVLDLQPRVHFHEVEQAARGFVQEFDGAHVLETRGAAEPHGRRAHGAIDVEWQIGGRRFLDHLLVPALHRRPAYVERPRRASTVGDDLDLAMARPIDPLLDKQRVVAERPPRFLPCRVEGAGEFRL